MQLNGRVFGDEESGIIRVGGARAVLITIHGREDPIQIEIMGSLVKKAQAVNMKWDLESLRAHLLPEQDASDNEGESWL